MTCGSCHQNEATIHLTEIVNNQMVEIHLCETCAEEKGTDFKTHFNFSELFSGLADLGSIFKSEQATDLRCKTCGLTFAEFGKTGRLGCAGCYQSLGKAILPLVKRVQRAAAHVGKQPTKVPKRMKQTMHLKDLQERLKKSVQFEEFEESAKLRDEIRKFEEKLEKEEKESKEKEKGKS